MTLIQNNLPSENSTPFYGPITIDFPNDYGTVEYDITVAYNFWKDTSNVNYGFTIYSPNIGCNNASVGFYVRSSDDTIAADRPYLKIYYPSQAGVEEDELKLSVYPNPCTEFFKINIAALDHYHFADITGSKFDLPYDASQGSFNTSLLAPGIYFLYVEKNGSKKAIRLIKK